MSEKIEFLMNPFTGSVSTAQEWRADFDSIAERDRPLAWGGAKFEDAQLIPVEWDDESDGWVEKK